MKPSIAAVALSLLPVACNPAPEALERSRSAVLNGADDRLEAFQVPERVRTPIVGASAALVYSHRLREVGPGSIALRAPSAGAALGLCADEPFASEPSAAFCSGVLIDDDLVATAQHCLGPELDLAIGRCHDLRVVFGYALASADGPIELRADDVFACRRVVALEGGLAVVELDRPVASPLSPRPIAAAGVRVGDSLVVASHGAGLPLKIELAAAVTEVSPSSGDLTVAMDTFGGSSGGGLFDQAFGIVGIVSGGDVDWDEINGCTRAAHSSKPRELAVAATALPGIVCRTGRPSRRLCGTPPVCGDGFCGAGESPDCAGDCPPPRCGDRVCEPAERGVCGDDCSRYDSVPESWKGEPSAYVSRDAAPADDARPATAGCSIARGAPTKGAVPWIAMLAAAAALGRTRRDARRTIKSLGAPN